MVLKGGQATAASSAEAAIETYLSGLLEARDILEKAYELDPEVVAIW
jgi:hypothetical protein